ncbi:Dual O-methyltransferase/FAD-dependent monooxygenase CTB3 [Pseudocercospora fuligena]|uniref:Dual O-methyltransferase/FAD-dependent monooxygenase CTB3 n=1 Tax=Pseudocercospora fuligena TaxID=685502 RepID=A0A8H6VQF8_9PEZI|nr:Dual O-methyltransferase/FAD-dependent monooxygenase CTB3 [Pseudocercospora fuligena]
MANQKILIVGGGLAGLALAQCLRKNNIDFEVFERDAEPQARSQGWAILLRECLAGMYRLFPDDMPSMEKNISVLDELDAEDAKVATNNGTDPTPCNFGGCHSQTGELLDRIASGSKEDISRHFIRANRASFRTWLSHKINVSWNKQFDSYEEDEHGVKVNFKDGSSAYGSLLVATDGASSHVRLQMLGAEMCQPKAASIDAISANITLSREEYAPLLAKGSAFVVANTGDFHFFIGSRSYHPENKTADYYWSVCLDRAKDQSSIEQTGSDWKASALAKVLEVTKPLHPSLRRYIENTKPSQMASTASQLLQWSPPSTLPAKRVILAGDALHAMTPFRGAGANTALLDAFDIAQLINQAMKKGVDVQAIVEPYNKIAIPRGQGMVEFSRSAAGFHDTHIDISIQNPVARIQAYIDSYAKAGGSDTFDNLLMTQTHLLSSTLKSASEDAMECFTVFSIPVIPSFCSAMGTMHGGCTSTIVDNCTTLAGVPLAQKDFWDAGGVSRTLNVTYLRPIPMGSEILVECIVRGLGRKMWAFVVQYLQLWDDEARHSELKPLYKIDSTLSFGSAVMGYTGAGENILESVFSIVPGTTKHEIASVDSQGTWDDMIVLAIGRVFIGESKDPLYFSEVFHLKTEIPGESSSRYILKHIIRLTMAA